MAKLWFQQLGFSKNPFSIKPAVFGNKLVGYDHVIEDLFYRIDAGGMVFVDGELGTGKTSLLKLITSRYGGLKRVMYFSCVHIKNSDLNEILFERIGFWRRLFGVKPKGMIILLDEVNELSPENVEKIKYFFDEDTIKSTVFTGVDYDKVGFSPSVRERINRSVIRLDNLHKEDAIKIVRNRIGKHPILTDDLITEIFKLSKGNPRKLLYNCEQVCRYAVTHGTERVTTEHLDAVMKGKGVVRKRPDEKKIVELQKQIKENITSLQHLQKDLLSIKGTEESEHGRRSKKGVLDKVVDIFDEEQ